MKFRGAKFFYGFTRPYDFTRALPFLSAIVLFSLITISIGVTALTGSLTWGSFRFYYFVYLELLALTAVALSFLPRLAWGLIALCFIELSFGVGTSALSTMNLLDDSLMPLDNPAEVDHSFRYHPLLQGTPVPNYSNLVPNYSELGRISVHHDNQGLRGFERSAALLKQQIVIATLGGSSTYDIGVPNGKTWSDFLEQKLGHEYAVLNHGVPGYSSVENLIQTIFYLNAYNIRPRCAVYYLGWNDIRNAHLPHLDPAYADFHLLTQSNSLGVRGRRSSNTLPYVSNISPLAGVLITYLQMSFDTVPLPESFVHKDPVSGTDGRLEIIFRANVQAIAAINKERKITSIFVGQIFNRPLLTTPSRPGWFPLLRNMDIWPLQDHFNHILKDTAEAVGSLWIIPPVDEFQNADFVDKGHFSPRGSEKFASILAPLVRANCKN